MKYILVILISFIFSINTYCSDPTTLNFCTNTSTSINLTDLLNCNELIVSDQSWTISSLKLGFEVNGNYYEQTITGNIIPQTFLDNVQTLSPNKIYFEDIVLTNTNSEEKSLKNMTIKVIN